MQQNVFFKVTKQPKDQKHSCYGVINSFFLLILIQYAYLILPKQPLSGCCGDVLNTILCER